MNYSDVMNELADLLADPKPEARVAAAKAIAYTGNPQGVPLLRLTFLAEVPRSLLGAWDECA